MPEEKPPIEALKEAVNAAQIELDHDGRCGHPRVARQLQRAFERLEAEHERYERILAMGGLQGDPPPKMLLCGQRYEGCDAWQSLHRVDVRGDTPEMATKPTLYIREDLANSQE